MNGFAAADLARAAGAAHAAMAGLEQELNEADARLGDGDTGVMLARVMAALAAVPPSADVGGTFAAQARVAAGATGSSLGTLLATALLTLSRETKGRAEVPWPDLAVLLGRARDAMMARGGAALGDKTVLDSLDAVARALEGEATAAGACAAARHAAQAALDAFRDRPNRVGRARMFAEATVGLDDPGMLAFLRLTDAIATAR